MSMVSRNPFRSQASASPSTQSPFPTSATSAPTGNFTEPATPSVPTVDNNKSTSNNEPQPSSSSSTDIVNEELPPAYTPAADFSQGEQTVQYGPTRPFQNAQPPVRPPPPQHPQATGWSAVQHHVVRPSPPQSLWQQITGSLADQLSGLSTNSNYDRYGAYPNAHYTGYEPSSPPVPPQFIPPPIPPPLPPRNNVSTPSASDFAQDFYAAGAGPVTGQDNTSVEHRPSQYPPPPGPPPSKPSGDNGRPTETPVPGRPLLNQGKILVYPPGYECDKCHNIGYKQSDPSHPCRKCWSKYAKPYAGAITYSSFDSSSAGTGKTFQRPLPLMHPPQAGMSHSGSQRATGYPGSAYVQNLGQGQNQYAPPPGLPPMITSSSSSYGYPPGAVVYAPGDPRLGGQQCWKCDGDGVIGGFLFEERCWVCSGVGRVYR